MGLDSLPNSGNRFTGSRMIVPGLGLSTYKVQKNDKIALISTNNRTEWNIMDIGILQVGAQNVPIYPTISENDYEYILNHSGSIFCFVSDSEVLRKINLIRQRIY